VVENVISDDFELENEGLALKCVEGIARRDTLSDPAERAWY
jgi:hypothetical protein